MGRKLIAALMAAAALVPTMATAQDRGDNRGDRGGRAERGQGGAWQQRQGGNEAARMQRAQQQAPTRNYQPIRPAQSLGARADAPRPNPGQTFRQERRDDRRNGQGFAGQGRPNLGQQYRQERRDGNVQRQNFGRQGFVGQGFAGQGRPDNGAFRRDGIDGRRDLNRDRRNEAQRGWARSGADWNDNYRDGGRRANWNDQRGFNGRDDRGGWNRDWRRDSRYDWNGWRGSNRNAFRLPRYYAPYGWNNGYQRFGIGATLASTLFAQSYWINDPGSYRLPDAYGDYQWVRYYNDALLVDTYSGEVVDVINDIFW
jgi:hypothetical protein